MDKGADTPSNSADTAAPLLFEGATPMKVAAWRVQDVTIWLSETCELPQYAEAFKSASIDGPMLQSLSAEDLEDELGIASSLHRRKILMRTASLAQLEAELPKTTEEETEPKTEPLEQPKVDGCGGKLPTDVCILVNALWDATVDACQKDWSTLIQQHTTDGRTFHEQIQEGFRDEINRLISLHTAAASNNSAIKTQFENARENLRNAVEMLPTNKRVVVIFPASNPDERGRFLQELFLCFCRCKGGDGIGTFKTPSLNRFFSIRKKRRAQADTATGFYVFGERHKLITSHRARDYVQLQEKWECVDPHCIDEEDAREGVKGVM